MSLTCMLFRYDARGRRVAVVQCAVFAVAVRVVRSSLQCSVAVIRAGWTAGLDLRGGAP